MEADASNREALVLAAECPQTTRRGGWRALRWGCLGVLLFVCAGLSALAIALQKGPVTLNIPGGSSLMVGSSSNVLSDATFQNGMTYFLDWNGNGVRDILELNYLSDSRSLEVVFHHATRQDRDENQLLQMRLP